MSTKPWVEGPLELFKHGIEHLQYGRGFDNRIAMISIDNAVELMIKTYLGLPARTTHIQGLSRKRYEEVSQSFSSLLDGLEEFAPDTVIGLELGDLEWFHRLRNALYHEGNGITVERAKVEGYAQIAEILFTNLFGSDAADLINSLPSSLIGEFFSNWAELERELRRRADTLAIPNRQRTVVELASRLVASGILPETIVPEFDQLRRFRNEVAHGVVTPTPDHLRAYNSMLKRLLQAVRGS